MNTHTVRHLRTGRVTSCISDLHRRKLPTLIVCSIPAAQAAARGEVGTKSPHLTTHYFNLSHYLTSHYLTSNLHAQMAGTPSPFGCMV